MGSDREQTEQTLSPEQTNHLKNILGDLLDNHFVASAKFEYLPGGYSNNNYLVQLAYPETLKKYVLRVPTVTQPYVDRFAEQQYYNTLPYHITAKPIAVNPHKGTMLSPWVAGETLAEVSNRYTPEDFATYLKTLHAALVPCGRSYSVRDLAFEFWETPPENIPTNTELAPCHNDLNPWNVLVTETGWITLDWEFAGDNDPLFDLVNLYLGLAEENYRWPILLPEFAKLCGFKGDELDYRLRQVQIQYWVRELGWAAFQIRNSNDRAEILQQHKVAAEALKQLNFQL